MGLTLLVKLNPTLEPEQTVVPKELVMVGVGFTVTVTVCEGPWQEVVVLVGTTP